MWGRSRALRGRTTGRRYATTRTVNLGRLLAPVARWTNYLTNALKYSPADRPVAVGITVSDREARVWVRDEGSGLPAEEQTQIWERFHRAREIVVQSGSGIGLGLGLYICRTIIERHQGRVGVESAPGRGSTFWFTVPLARRGVEHTCVTSAKQETLMRRHP
jgi:K+-sensing histidine kinase KdpD